MTRPFKFRMEVDGLDVTSFKHVEPLPEGSVVDYREAGPAKVHGTITLERAAAPVERCVDCGGRAGGGVSRVDCEFTDLKGSIVRNVNPKPPGPLCDNCLFHDLVLGMYVFRCVGCGETFEPGDLAMNLQRIGTRVLPFMEHQTRHKNWCGPVRPQAAFTPVDDGA